MLARLLLCRIGLLQLCLQGMELLLLLAAHVGLGAEEAAQTAAEGVFGCCCHVLSFLLNLLLMNSLTSNGDLEENTLVFCDSQETSTLNFPSIQDTSHFEAPRRGVEKFGGKLYIKYYKTFLTELTS